MFKDNDHTVTKTSQALARTRCGDDKARVLVRIIITRHRPLLIQQCECGRGIGVAALPDIAFGQTNGRSL